MASASSRPNRGCGRSRARPGSRSWCCVRRWCSVPAPEATRTPRPLDRARPPLPFGAIRNRRSLIHIDSLCRAIVASLQRPQAGGRTYLVADRDWSTPMLVRALAASVGREARLLPVPVPLLRLAGRLTRREAEVERLVGSLCVDASAARADLDLPYDAPPP